MEDEDEVGQKGAFQNFWKLIVAMLTADSGLEAKTILKHLMDDYPGKFRIGQLRTLQRYVRDWRVMNGPEKEVYFSQVAECGRQSQSDFTDCSDLKVSIDRTPFDHSLFHFMLPYSRWETCQIAFSESFENLSNGYANAVKELGGCAKQHRTDNLSAAVKLGPDGPVFTERWVQFMDHYGVEPTRNNAGKGNENGSVEKSHDLLKRALDQRLRLRKSRDFRSQTEYEKFVRETVTASNKGRKVRFEEERNALLPLPKNSWSDTRELWPRVTAFSTISVFKAVYSVPSRMIGIDVRALVSATTVKVYYGNRLVQEMARLPEGGRQINYRHIIASLVRKPGAFARYQYRSELFPTVVFRKLYDELRQRTPARADREYVQILYQAAMGSESDVETAVNVILEEGQVPTSSLVRSLVETRRPVPGVVVQEPSISEYDLLLSDPGALKPEEISDETKESQSE